MIIEGINWRRLDDPRPQALAEGATLRVVFRGKAIRFLRSRGGLHALADQCPHQGKSFEGGWCDTEGLLVCPWHRFAFDPVTGRSKHGSCANVEVVPLAERDDGLYLGFQSIGLRLLGFELWLWT